MKFELEDKDYNLENMKNKINTLERLSKQLEEQNE
jgi:hypothetical protein